MLMPGNGLLVLPTLPDASASGIVTDPPYAVGATKKWDDTRLPPQQIWSECARVLKPGHHLLAFAAGRMCHRLAADIEAAGLVVRTMLAWCYAPGVPKSVDVSRALDAAGGGERPLLGYREVASIFDKTAPRSRKNIWSSTPIAPIAKTYAGFGSALAPAHEPIVWATKPLPGGELPPLPPQSRALFYKKPSPAERAGNNHPTVKPVALMRDLIARITQPGDVVLDPFAGSGTTGVAALMEGRSFILIEQDEAFCRIIARRIEATESFLRGVYFPGAALRHDSDLPATGGCQ